MKLKCIKGVATDYFVVCLQGDIIELCSIDENEIEANGIFGWCMGHELVFTAKEFADSFVITPENVPPTLG
jgi:hypothetical protein